MENVRPGVTITWYDDPAEAESDLKKSFDTMSPDERVAETLFLMVMCAGWQLDGRFERSAQFIEFA